MASLRFALSINHYSRVFFDQASWGVYLITIDVSLKLLPGVVRGCESFRFAGAAMVLACDTNSSAVCCLPMISAGEGCQRFMGLSLSKAAKGVHCFQPWVSLVSTSMTVPVDRSSGRRKLPWPTPSSTTCSFGSVLGFLLLGPGPLCRLSHSFFHSLHVC